MELDFIERSIQIFYSIKTSHKRKIITNIPEDFIEDINEQITSIPIENRNIKKRYKRNKIE